MARLDALIAVAVACFAAEVVAQATQEPTNPPPAPTSIACNATATGTTVGAPNLLPDLSVAPTVVFQLELASETGIRASTCEQGSTTNFDSVLSLFSGTDLNFDNLILENDDSLMCDGFLSQFTTGPLPPGTYSIVVGGFSETDAGDFSLAVSCGDFPDPDVVDPAPEGSGSCENNCGDFAGGNPGCFCDEVCAAFDDCCADFQQFCPNIVPVDPVIPTEPVVPVDPVPEPVAS